MKYRNKNTGAILEVPCVIKGENWEVVKEKKATSNTTKKTKKKTTKKEK